MSATPQDVLEGRATWCVVEADCLAALSVLGDAGAMVDHVISDPPFERIAAEVSGLSLRDVRAGQRGLFEVGT